MSETVRVEFDPPRQCEQVGKAWKLSAEGEDDLWLPTAETRELVQEGETVVAATIPQWLAVKEKLVDDNGESYRDAVWDGPSFLGEEERNDKMTRDDCFLLGMTMAVVIRGESYRDAVWEGRRLARRLRKVREEE